MTTYTCDRCEQPFVPVKESYTRRCQPCADAFWREQQPPRRPPLEHPRTYTCHKCKNEFQSTFDSPYPQFAQCSDCMVEDIMKYADTFGVD